MKEIQKHMIISRAYGSVGLLTSGSRTSEKEENFGGKFFMTFFRHFTILSRKISWCDDLFMSRSSAGGAKSISCHRLGDQNTFNWHNLHYLHYSLFLREGSNSIANIDGGDWPPGSATVNTNEQWLSVGIIIKKERQNERATCRKSHRTLSLWRSDKLSETGQDIRYVVLL